jgi:hypothetical protein
MAKINVTGTDIAVININDTDYISLTDMAHSQLEEHIIIKWLSLKNTIEYIHIDAIKQNLSPAELFQASKQNVSLHINNIFKEGELNRQATRGTEFSIKNLCGVALKNETRQFELLQGLTGIMTSQR